MEFVIHSRIVRPYPPDAPTPAADYFETHGYALWRLARLCMSFSAECQLGRIEQALILERRLNPRTLRMMKGVLATVALDTWPEEDMAWLREDLRRETGHDYPELLEGLQDAIQAEASDPYAEVCGVAQASLPRDVEGPPHAG